ncbi:hypothetical protein [Loigolactobacillus binensis]|uniref:Lipoprotein n=1 Tax=Loigolactobacillus binensis TaxID=2559922 RepID=A0ABW3EEA1_9LACO|nr:hypothetical protein [Loigolactobacillus binensis]
MKKLFGVLLVGITATTLVGCSSGSTQDSTSSSSPQSSQVSKKTSAKKTTGSSRVRADKTTASTASSQQANGQTSSAVGAAGSSSSTTTSNSNSATAKAASGSSQATNQQSAATTANGQNLTTAQVQAWVTRYVSGDYQAGDLSYAMSKDENGELVIQVRENHNSANQQAQGADTNTAPTVGWFKINSQGQLLSSADAGASWQVISNRYQ